MFATMRNAAAAYATVGIDVQAETSDPHKLIVMLFEGAHTSLTKAMAQLANGDVMEMSKHVSKAIEIISEGLLASLDMQAGGELAARLASLYDYMCLRLRSINFKGDAAVLKEVDGLLMELGSAWKEIHGDPSVLSANKRAA